MGEKLDVVVLAGGRSSEHDVSLASGAAVHAGLEAAGHSARTAEIGRDGIWRLGDELLSLQPGRGLLGADVVFPALHGPFGEDGTIQGVLEALDVAYVGSGVAASAVCLDKVLFKRLMSTAAVPQVEYVGVGAERFGCEPASVLEEVAGLGLPVFVKPAHLGSSVGIAKVSSSDRLRGALEDAFAHDELVIVEAMSVGTEVECAVLGVPAGEAQGAGRARASQPGEIVISAEFYDYQAKYTPGGMELKVPAHISQAARERVMALACQAFVYAECDGLARADFFVDGDEVLLNELNTMPGFTPTSVYAKLWDASGLAYPPLVDTLCRLALERHARRAALRH
jgi:D-alanine-D-alanine ligase